MALASSCLASQLLSGLSVADRSALTEGKQVVVQREVPGLVWPELTVYQTVNASPEEVMAVFFDYNSARAYVPNVLKSEISAVLSSCVMDVDYAVDVPVFADEFYTARNSLSAVDGGGYVVAWKLLRAVQTKDSVGEFRVEPFGNQSLVCYRNLTTPSSAVARLLRAPAMKQMRQTATAILKEVARQKADQPDLLQKRVKALRAALAR